MNAIVPHHQSNAETYRASTDAAGLCREIVLQTAQKIQGRKYVKVEGWQAIAVAHGCVASAENVERVNDEGMSGFRATGTVRRMSDGALISQAEGFVGDDETMWAKRPVYARRAMVQTRAISRACRSAFAHVVILIDANLSTTPAEEVPLGGFDNGDVIDHAPQPDAPRRYNANQCKTVTTTRPDNGEVIAKGALAAALAHEMTDILEVTELMAWRRTWEPEVATWPLNWETKFWNDYDIHMADLRRLTDGAFSEQEAA